MAHYAFLDKNNVVTEVITGIDETELIEGLDPETWYGNFRGQKCKRTSYSMFGNKHTNEGTPFRANFAKIGGSYDPEWDAFIPPKPYESWILNYETFLWEPPIPMPPEEDGYIWRWGEANKNWVKIAIQ